VSKAVVTAGWDDVPHLSEAEKARLLASYPPHMRDARTKGIPSIGAGAIYPVSLDDLLVDDHDIPGHWEVGYGMDVGWKATAVVRGALDRTDDIICLTGEYKRGQAEPASHAAAIRLRCPNMIGAIDPASRGRSQKDGSRLIDEYEALGLQLVPAENAVEAGLFEVWTRMTTGRLKIFRSLGMTLQEMRLYRRDERGQVVKENDHLMDCVRYLVMTKDRCFSWAGGHGRTIKITGALGERTVRR